MLDHPDTAFTDGGVDYLNLQLYSEVGAAVLPSGAYTSEVFQRLEDEKIWTRDWVCIGTTPQIANPFDLLPYTIGNHAIHAQRMPDGTLVGRFNKAQHGGCRTVPAQCQTGKKTRCSYTSCGFSRDRDVISGASLQEMSPQTGQYLGLRPERLLPVKLRAAGPLIFANIDPTPESEPDLDAPDLGTHIERRDGNWQEHRSNWKLAVAAIVDAAEAWAGEVSVKWTFPNLVLVRAHDATLAVILQPTAMDQTLWRLSFFAAPDLPEGAFETVRGELFALLERAAGEATARQATAERTTPGDRFESSRAASSFNQAVIERITRQHVSYWNVPLMRA